MKPLRPEDLLSATRLPRLTGKVTVTHNETSLWLPGGADLTFDNGDIIRAVSDASGNWRVIDIQKNSAPARGKITANRTYYVRTDGNDNNTGLSNTSGGAYLTIQRAVDEVASNIDIAGFTVTIQVADGTYTTPIVLKNVVGFAAAGNLVIKGNPTTPANVVVSVTGADAFSASGINVVWDITDLKVTTTTSGQLFNIVNNAKIRIGNINFGTSAFGHMVVGFQSVITIISNYTVSGGGAYHMNIAYGSVIQAPAITITITGTPAFGAAWVNLDVLGTAQIFGQTFVGSATGKRYIVNSGSVCFVNGATTTYLPGSIAGTTSSNGQYL
jgi:hypothetical protein